MSIPRGDGIANNGHFYLEIEMLPDDKIKRVIQGAQRKHMVFPKGRGKAMELLCDSKWMKPSTAVGLVRCSKMDLCVYKWYMREFKGSGRKFATSLGTKGVL